MYINTGKLIYNTLSERIINTETFTGKVKANDPEDPDYIAPITDEEFCDVSGSFVDIIWSNQQSYTPFADCDLQLWINGEKKFEELNDNSGIYSQGRAGDTLLVKQTATSAWSPNSSSRLIVKANDVTVFDQTQTTYDSILNTFELVLDFDTEYEIISTSTSLYGNQQLNQIFTRNNCADGLIPTTYNYIVPVNTFFASTQIEANNLAYADIATNGQSTANSNADCLVPFLEFHSYVQNKVNGGTISASLTGDITQILSRSTFDNTTVIKDTLPGILYTMLNLDGNGRILITESAGQFKIFVKSNGLVTIGCGADFDARITFVININGLRIPLETTIISNDAVGGYNEVSSPYSLLYNGTHTLPLGAYIDTNIENCLVSTPNGETGTIIINASEMEIQIQQLS